MAKAKRKEHNRDVPITDLRSLTDHGQRYQLEMGERSFLQTRLNGAKIAPNFSTPKEVK